MKEFEFNVRHTALAFKVQADTEEDAVRKARSLLEDNRRNDGTLLVPLDVGWERASLAVSQTAIYAGAIAKVTELTEQPF